MKPKEKAKQLVDKMHLQMPVKIIPTASTRANELSCNIDLKGSIENAKQCALIAVDEIINYLTTSLDVQTSLIAVNYWQEVKQEIDKL